MGGGRGACLIVTEFPAGMTLKNYPQEESRDVRKTFSGSICCGELRLCRVCAQGPGLRLSKWNTVTFLLLRRQDQPIQHISVPSSTAQYLLLCSKGEDMGAGDGCLGHLYDIICISHTELVDEKCCGTHC